MSREDRRFPWVLTASALTAIAVLVGLGVWQLQRLAWKEALLAKIAALGSAPARPLPGVLAQAAPVDFMRASAACAAGPQPAATLYRYAVRDGRIGWRLLGVCHLAAGRYDGIVLDRGVVERLMGATSPVAAMFRPAGEVIGVLRSPGGTPMLGPALMEEGQGFAAWRVLDRSSLAQIAGEGGLERPAPYILAVEHETPPAPGLAPAALPGDIPNNHLVYALTWFALAVILAWFYGAMLVGRLRR
jgi:surfeit locus 1 family protein